MRSFSKIQNFRNLKHQALWEFLLSPCKCTVRTFKVICSRTPLALCLSAQMKKTQRSWGRSESEHTEWFVTWNALTKFSPHLLTGANKQMSWPFENNSLVIIWCRIPFHQHSLAHSVYGFRTAFLCNAQLISDRGKCNTFWVIAFSLFPFYPFDFCIPWELIYLRVFSWMRLLIFNTCE